MPGHFLIERIESALGGADAILVLLSKNSIQSEWCKKELRSGLIRELEEKSVLVIPIVLDTCEIPLSCAKSSGLTFGKTRMSSLRCCYGLLSAYQTPRRAVPIHLSITLTGQ